jgi:cytochrome c biogenesis protein CcdA
MVVVADSPLLSTLVAQNAQAEIKGTTLTIVNSIGFAITIISIQLIDLSGLRNGDGRH